ncbi:MAG: endonuclease [Bacteroidales bacterium]
MKRIFTYISLLLFLTSSVFAQIPAGYYNTATGLSGESLRSALKIIIKAEHVKLTYTPGVWYAYASTDVKLINSDSIIWDMYTDIPNGTPLTTLYFRTGQCGTSNAEGICYSREHCMPNSWWGGLDDGSHPQYTDLHHLFPADQYVNTYKSDNPIGQVGTPTYTSNNGSKLGPCSYPGYTGVVFEPINEYKGDFARAYLYMATRYMDSLSAWVNNYPHPTSAAVINLSGNNFKQWFIYMMLAWHNADPVSSKEINRNNAIYYNTLQHNRNPFIDHPEYVQAIWGGILKPEPSNHTTNFHSLNSSDLNSSITVSWTDAVGTIAPDGYLIRASTLGFSQILPPTDSITENITTLQKIAYQGFQSTIFTGLTPGTLYYFKIFPYTNNGNNINYKTDGFVPADSTFAGPILAWQFGNPASLGNDTTYNATTNNSNINTSSLLRGSGINPSSLVRSYSSTSWNASSTKADAVINNEYIGFIFHPKTGYKISLTSLDATLRRSSTAPNFYIWKFSTDGSNFTEINTDVSFTSTDDGVNQAQINLSSISSLQNITNSTTITFRIYAWGSTSSASTFAIGRYSAGITTNSLAIGGSISPIPPILAVSSITAFGNQCTNTTTGPNSFTITGSDLTNANVTVAELNGFTFATASGGSYTSTLTISQSGGSFSQTIFVKFSPTEAISYDGNITVSGGGSNTVMRSVSGSGIHTVAGALTTTASSILGGQNAELTLTGNTGTITKWQKSINAGSLWTDILSTANPFSETPISLGSIDYRTIVQNGICPEALSNQASIVVNPNSTTFTAANNNDWNTTTNWNNGIPNKLYNVTIPANILAEVDSSNNECNNLTILGQLTINPFKNISVKGSLSIQSDATATGSIIESNGLNAIVQRYIANPNQFHMLASAVANQSISSIVSSSDSLFLWSEPNETWTSYTANNFTTINGGSNFQTGKAYAVSFPSVVTKNFSGALNHGNVNIPLTVTTGNFSGWNYIANPYPSAINWNSASGFRRTMLANVGSASKAIWIWNPDSANYGCYLSESPDPGTLGVSQNIAAGQGFWVKAVNADTLKMNDSVRVHASQSWLKSSTASPEMLRMNVTGNGNSYSDEIIIHYGKPSAQLGAEKMYSMDASAPSLYSTKFNKNWCINYLTTITDHPTVPIGFKAGVNGIYTLHFTGNEQFNQLILEDLQTGIQKNMITSSSYTFVAQTTDNADRFLLHFTSVANNINVIQNSGIQIYTNNSTICINAQEKINEIIVYTLLGQVLLKQTGNMNTIRNIPIENAAAYYLVKVITEKNVYTKKLFVN